MSDLAVALGLVLVIEGSLWALSPGLGHKLLQASAGMQKGSLRLVGALAVACGVFIIWLVRG